MAKYNILIVIIGFLFALACASVPHEIDIERQFGRLPQKVISPADNPSTLEKLKLGELLFWDPIISGDRDIACASCHHPHNGFAENIALSIGVGGRGLSESRNGGRLVNRNAPTILNAGFIGINSEGHYKPELAPMFWDSRINSLEEQSIMPLLSAVEMRGENITQAAIVDTIINRLKNIPKYNHLFDQAFGTNGITKDNIGKAIATFERSLISNTSKFDQFVNGMPNALSSLELKGLNNFVKSGCANCHNGPMFSDFETHILTVPENKELESPDDGNGKFAFRTPSLRNLKFTAPYMHNGVFQTLDEVMEFYDDVDDNSQNENVASNQRDQKLIDLDISRFRKKSIIAFLNTLNDSSFKDNVINKVPSDLQSGGNIYIEGYK